MGSLPKSFNDLISTANKPVLVDFYADWCAPCKMVSPIIQNLAKEYSGKIITVKINIDKKQQIASQFQVQSIPTIMMFYKGKTLFRLTGAQPYAIIHEILVFIPRNSPAQLKATF